MTRFEVWKRKTAKQKRHDESKFSKALNFSRYLMQAAHHPERNEIDGYLKVTYDKKVR